MSRQRVSVVLVMAVVLGLLGMLPAAGGAGARAVERATERAAAGSADPVVTSVFPRDGAVDVQFVAGSGAAADFVVIADPGEARTTVGPDDRYARVTGLRNGTAYRFMVVQRKLPSLWRSQWSQEVTPESAQLPLAPILDHAHGRDGSVEVEWTPPDDGGSPLTGYTVTASGGGDTVTVKTAASQLNARVPGLVDGTAYRVAVRAVNKAGTGEPATKTVTPGPDRVPGAPTDVSAVPQGNSDRELLVRWSAPEDDGGPRITGYTVTVGDTVVQASGGQRQAVVTGLDAAELYAVSVSADNAVGSGPAGEAETEVSPRVDVDREAKVLTAGSLDQLTATKDKELRFLRPNGQLRGLKRGDVIVSNTDKNAPAGLLRKVTATRMDGETLVVTTEDAALPDVLDHSQLAMAGDWDTDRTGTTVYHKGVSPGPLVADGELSFGLAVAPNTDHPGATASAGGTIRGSITIDPHWDLTWTTSKSSWGVDALDFTAEADVKASIDADIGISAGYTSTIPLAQTTLAPIVFTAGPIPIVIIPTLSLSAELTFSGGFDIHASFTYAQHIGARAGYDSQEWYSENTTTAPVATADVSLGRTKATLQASLPIDVSLQFYGLAGPGLQIAPYLQAVIAAQEDPWLTVRAGLSGSLSVSIAAIPSLTFRLPLLDVSRDILTLNGTRPGLYIDDPVRHLQPGTDTAFEVKRADWCTAPVTFSLAPGSPGTLTPEGRYTAPATPGTARIIATQAAYGECGASTAEAIVLTGKTPPSVPRYVRGVLSDYYANLQTGWEPPEDDGGDPDITYALVLTLPDTRSHVVSTTASTRYTITDPATLSEIRDQGGTLQVIASNKAGDGPISPPADITIVTVD
ncbi:fibronectin type III domain-containing protein [Streptomyces albipurpureus]|uniref:Fibronectin type III domain-containing protein n=1 Tax=Streptomyces albipurpureus TaxID=2897419 RepID=A0ABT0V2F3_9ACTN|nr:fibronectin type III domain-containing protein [Streptomyces sp. CWNU-1]MCM2393566.1 fibronectin type III domain-containing protein [Streptomyces sp. CWNU-1]